MNGSLDLVSRTVVDICPDCHGDGFIVDTDASLTGQYGAEVPCFCSTPHPAPVVLEPPRFQLAGLAVAS